MPDKNTIARPYARAIFQIGREKQQLPLWAKFLENLEIIALNKDFNNLVENPSFQKGLAMEVAAEEATRAALDPPLPSHRRY